MGADIKVKEPDFEAMTRGKKKFLPPRFMTVNTALEQLLIVEEKRKEGGTCNAASPVGNGGLAGDALLWCCACVLDECQRSARPRCALVWHVWVSPRNRCDAC